MFRKQNPNTNVEAIVTLVWVEDPSSKLPTAWYRGYRIQPSTEQNTPSDARYLTRATKPAIGSVETADLIKSPTGRSFIAHPVSFSETIMPGIMRPAELYWRRDEKGPMKACIQVAVTGQKFTVYKGEDQVMDRLGSRKAARWNKRAPQDNEMIACWIVWNLTPNGYPVGHAYRVDERTASYRDIIKSHMAVSLLI